MNKYIPSVFIGIIQLVIENDGRERKHFRVGVVYFPECTLAFFRLGVVLFYNSFNTDLKVDDVAKSLVRSWE